MLSLGLGIGVNTAMFSLGVEFLLSQPSVSDPGSVVSVQLGGNSVAPRNLLRVRAGEAASSRTSRARTRRRS